MQAVIPEPLVFRSLSQYSQDAECILCCRYVSYPFCYSLWPVEALWDQRDIQLRIHMDKGILHICERERDHLNKSAR